MACPFFVPRELVSGGSWPHPARLPLGGGWKGGCCASGSEITAPEESVREFCNLGYAAACPQLPAERDWDAIRFSVAHANSGQLTLWYVCEAGHAPRKHGQLTFDLDREVWLNPHGDVRVQRLADSYVRAFRSRQGPGELKQEDSR